MEMKERDKQYAEELLTKTTTDFNEGDEKRKSAILGVLTMYVGMLVGALANDESHLLDGIDLCAKKLRQSAADTFVDKQKFFAKHARD